MAAKSPNGIPAYRRIERAIRSSIEAGGLKPGDIVTSERKLAQMHNVSLMTARQALVSLEREGLVERRRGVGTFVTAPKIQFNKLMSYTEQMGSRRLLPVSRTLFAKIINDEEEAAARLSIPPKSPVLKLERLRQAAGEPFALETCYLSAAQFSGILSAQLHMGSLFNTLERVYGVELGYSDEEVDATMADASMAELLAVPKREPLLRIRQVIHSTDGVVVLYVLGLYRSDRHNLLIRRYR
jgi:GntR family transcriptional regulator